MSLGKWSNVGGTMSFYNIFMDPPDLNSFALKGGLIIEGIG